jgi:hypothetical protein
MPKALYYALAATLVILFGLEIWRPYFFLTDDNLSGTFPVLTEIGRQITHGQSPFVSRYVFNGNYHLLFDISAINWHPLYLLSSLLAGTSGHNAIIDISSIAIALLSVSGFVFLGVTIRRELHLALSDVWIAFLAISYTFSMYGLSISASWITEYGSLSALPWLAIALFQPTWKRMLLFTAGAFINAILIGHPESAISSFVWLTLLAVGVCRWRRAWWPLLSWLGGHVMACLILSPLLILALRGFLNTVRSAGLSLEHMGDHNMSALGILTSYFLGGWASHLGAPVVLMAGPQIYLGGLAASLAGMAIIPVLACRKRWSALEITSVIILFVLVFMIVRPMWVNVILSHIPVLKSFRWPFRELLQLLFFLHLLFLLRISFCGKWAPWVVGAGALWTLSPLIGASPPSFDGFTTDRALILGGQADAYWTEVAPLLDPSAPTITVFANQELFSNGSNYELLPFTFLNTYNYPDLFHVRSISGYSLTSPIDQLGIQVLPPWQFGAFLPDQMTLVSLMGAKCNELEITSDGPLQIVLHRPDGRIIDLTPIVNKYLRQITWRYQ